MNAQQLQDMVDHFSREIGHAVSSVAPQAFHTMVVVEQVDCVGALISMGTFALLSGLGLLICAGVLRWTVLQPEKRLAAFLAVAGNHPNYYNDEVMPAEITLAIVSGVAGIVSLILLCCNIIGLCNYWLWIGAYNPTVAVYHDLITAALSNVSGGH